MRHGSLFSGIGGFDLAARWMGWDNVFHVEFNPWCRKVLEYHFPDSKSYVDVKQFDGTQWRGKVDIISGGFPCQPYSAAGKRMGKDDERHLWPEMCRIIREAAPRYVVGENVRGLTNWNGGVVFEEVCADLEVEGYEVWTGILPAAGVGAPHRRDRVWFVAHAHERDDRRAAGKDAGESGEERLHQRDAVRQPIVASEVQRYATNANRGGLERATSERRHSFNVERQSEFGDAANAGRIGGLQGLQEIQPKQPKGEGTNGNGSECNATNADGGRWQKRDLAAEPNELGFGRGYGGQDDGNTDRKASGQVKSISKEKPKSTGIGGHNRWAKFPTEPPICGGDDGLSRQLDGITFPKWRNESIKAYGNAIVPQVAYAIFRAIFDAEARL